MKITQGTFSFLEDLTDEQIDAQIRYSIEHGWSLSIEYTDDPHPRNIYWEMWGLPRFDLTIDQSDVVMREVRAAREAFPEAYIKVIAYDSTRGRQTSALSFIVNRPTVEHGFQLERTEDRDRVMRYRLVHLNKPVGSVGVGNMPIRGNDGGSITE
jgi:ribulose-bisphosphate carboxylase small chain